MKTLLLTILAALFLSACVSKTRWDISATQKKILEVQPGMNKAQVVAILGTPNSREVIPDKEGQPIEFLQYQTRFTGDAVLFAPKDSDMTPFMFINDRLIGWGRNYYDRTIRHEFTVREFSESKVQTDTKVRSDESEDIYTELKKLDELRKQGIITEQEFEVQKKKILEKK